jgi:hypothetical protein
MCDAAIAGKLKRNAHYCSTGKEDLCHFPPPTASGSDSDLPLQKILLVCAFSSIELAHENVL